MKSGSFEVLQIGYDSAGEELFRATGSSTLSLAYIKSERLIAGCIGLNVLITLLSVIALFAVVCRRFEAFSTISLALFALSATASTVL